MVEHQDVFADGRAREPVLLRGLGERGLQRAEREEVERGVAPLQEPERLERMALQRVRELGLKGRTAARRTKAAVTGGAAGTTGYLGKLGRVETAELVAVELAIGRKRDVID